MTKTILVTGGAGYIGSHTCKALAHAGYEPIVYDNLSTGHREFVRWGRFVHGNILDTEYLVETLRRYDACAVVHFAAKAYVGESVLRPDIYYHTNVCGTLSLLQAMHRCHVSHIVVSSTCAVYGQPDLVPITEECPLAPVNPYGFTKLAMERMLDDFERAYGITGVALRYFNAAGADPDGEAGELHNPETHLIPRVLMAATGRIPGVDVYGGDYPTPDGTCIRDYIHVTDLADAHVRALEHLLGGRGALRVNLGVGRGYSVKEVIALAEKTLGCPVPYAMHERRAGDPPHLVADACTAGSILGWQPKFSTMENILQTAANFFAARKYDNPVSCGTNAPCA